MNDKTIKIKGVEIEKPNPFRFIRRVKQKMNTLSDYSLEKAINEEEESELNISLIIYHTIWNLVLNNIQINEKYARS